MTIEHILNNASPTLARNDMLEGREHIVVPMVMLVEGVLVGNNARKMYYPAQDIEKSVPIWNHKPVVVYHPQINGEGVSACSPEVMNTSKVGVILNTKFEKGKLRAEAWLDKSLLHVDPRIEEYITNKQVMEVSTGVFVDAAEVEGEFNGKPYELIATNHRPDHLALLPDQIGACSVKDGAGLLQLNEMSYDNVRQMIQTKLREANAPMLSDSGPSYYDNPWVLDVYSDFFVYEYTSKLYRQGYTKTDTEVTITGSPEEVVRVTEYRTVAGTFVGNLRNPPTFAKEGVEMTKLERVNGLITNASTKWSESDRAWLLAQNEDTLAKLEPEAPATPAAPAANTAPPEAPAAPVLNTQAPAAPVAPAQPLTVDQYISNAPPEVGHLLRAGMLQLNAAKQNHISTIMANERNKFTKEFLESKTPEELAGMALLAGNTQQGTGPVPMMFQGQAIYDAPVLNQAGDLSSKTPLPLPSWNDV